MDKEIVDSLIGSQLRVIFIKINDGIVFIKIYNDIVMYLISVV